MRETKKNQMHEENYEGLNEQELEDVTGGVQLLPPAKPASNYIVCPKCGKSLSCIFHEGTSVAEVKNQRLSDHYREEHKENSL